MTIAQRGIMYLSVCYTGFMDPLRNLYFIKLTNNIHLGCAV